MGLIGEVTSANTRVLCPSCFKWTLLGRPGLQLLATQVVVASVGKKNKNMD